MIEQSRERFAEDLKPLQVMVRSWKEAKCPCRFPDWSPDCGLIGDDETMKEFGESQGGKFVIALAEETP